ncbi:MAG: heat-inducible transcriptional repressor HrcA [Alphaproteobacteria bacterium]|nr:heat-inducible transcriptional repressor HrcA [Alphaproteobacteria bacterium]
MINELNARTREILKLVVDAYVETGAPVGSVAVSQKLGMKLSPATIRSAMAELEDLGLLYAPHKSAGRLPTETGLSVFVEGLLELDTLNPADQKKIDDHMAGLRAHSVTDIYEETSALLSGLSSCAGLVFAQKAENDPIRQIEFVLLSPGRAMAVLVTTAGMVENRLLDVGLSVDAATLQRASNYLNARMADKTLQQAIQEIRAELATDRKTIDELAAKIVETGIASFAPGAAGGHLFIRGQAQLLEDVEAAADIERVRRLFEKLEARETMLEVLQATTAGEGVKIFIGAENSLFNHSGCSMIVAPCRTEDARIVGALGVIGPARLHYGRIIPVINYTSEIIGKIFK